MVVAVIVVVILIAGGVYLRVTRGSSSAPVSSSGYAANCLAVGAAVNAPEKVEGAGLSLFRKAADELGPISVRRSFDTSLPRTFAASAAGGDAAAGVHSFVSWKPPQGDYRCAAAGRYDDQVTAWAKSVPTTGVYATAWHEPENDMSAADFVALQRHLYTVVKAANPTIHWGPVYMAYWWDPNNPGHYVGDPAAWWPGAGYADFAGLDWYGPDPTPMTGSASFQTWFSTMSPTGVPLYITEYGQYVVAHGKARNPAKEQRRIRAIAQDAAWIAAHPRIRMWMYWDAVGAQGDWRLRDKASQQAWRTVAETGCRP
ncbi:MAG: hypothetical protein ACXVF9_20340 [Blastococcus sp.]